MLTMMAIRRIYSFGSKPLHIAPLAAFRVAFGLLAFVSILRFIAKGWVHELYVMPKFYFSYYGFEWVKPLPEPIIYIFFGVMALSALGIMLGYFYRVCAGLFFLTFTYVELIDKTNYLNHYYFISLIAFLLIWLPAHRFFSVDVWRGAVKPLHEVPAWCIRILQGQLFLVYFLAGIAKINSDWLLEAMPLKIWLPAKGDMPLIGPLLYWPETAYVFSWAGMVFDVCIGFFFFWRPSRPWAYLAAAVFHLATSMLFQIGMFPYIMMVATLIFFSAEWHLRWMCKVSGVLANFGFKSQTRALGTYRTPTALKWLIGVYITVQLILPFRYLLYPGNLFWTEEGYRFSWRVMLMEKNAMAYFTIQDSKTGKLAEVMNCDYLTRQQEKMMSTQPDMMLQYAHFLAEEYEKKGFVKPQVKVESFAVLNGKGSRRFVSDTVDLNTMKEGFASKKWICPYEE